MKPARNLISLLLLFSICGVGFCNAKGSVENNKAEKSPRIVNIINFIRKVEPRDASITEQILLETVRSQIKLMTRYDLPATFLLQYDALITPEYQELLKNELSADSEIGGWWEITQPHVEAAGLKWRGRYEWDWHADIGFSTGYTPQEREKLVDVYMEQFKSIFGRYPASVGSWFIDSHTLGYMYDKYGITASCNCKDQYGTDGYTLWGGYWNQAYYPSRVNAFMPAQTKEGQIPVPIFRMLGSDPIYQYDTGLGGNLQGVISLEPVYPTSGGDSKWVDWFFKTMFTEPCLAFNYVQAGQENSFTWDAMGEGLEMQMPKIAKWRDNGNIRVETLGRSGEWFKANFPTTPATAVTAMTDDYINGGHKTVWYNSRYYRANLMWENDLFWFRDIHLFNEKMESKYLRTPVTSNQCFYTTLPVVDGFLWSSNNYRAGLRVVKIDSNGDSTPVSLSNPVVKEIAKDLLEVICYGESGVVFKILFHEDKFEVKCTDKKYRWAMELTVAPDKIDLPFTKVSQKEIEATVDNFNYSLKLSTGNFTTSDDGSYIFRIIPQNSKLIVRCK